MRRTLTLVSALAVLTPVTTSAGDDRVRTVAGTGVHYATTAIVHTKETTATGFVQRSTETVDLEGDLSGRVLYHPRTVVDLTKGTLVNTGHQVFSGTVLGSAPVLLHDDTFRFEVDFNAQTEAGEVHLRDVLAGPRIRCDLKVAGTGRTPEGNGTFSYTGECTLRED